MKKIKNQTICMIALFTAVISIMAQFSIPLPFGVPLSLQNFAIALTAILLGSQYGTLSIIIYLALGVIGLPVFANFRSGLQSIFSPAGGFLLGYPLMAYLIGIGSKYHYKKSIFINFIFLGYLMDYLVGLVVFCLITSTDIKTGIITCILPFLPAELIKASLAGTLGLQLKKKLYFLFHTNI